MKQHKNDPVKKYRQHVTAKNAWGWEQKTNPPRLRRKISLFMPGKKVSNCVQPCVQNIRYDSPPIQLWHFGHHQEGVRMESGQCSPGRCYTFLLECRDLDNYTTATSVNRWKHYLLRGAKVCAVLIASLCVIYGWLWEIFFFSPRVLGPVQSNMERNKRQCMQWQTQTPAIDCVLHRESIIILQLLQLDWNDSISK